MKIFNGEDDVPLYIIRHEAIGYGRKKVWTVREQQGVHRLVTVMPSKRDAIGWVVRNEKSSCYR